MSITITLGVDDTDRAVCFYREVFGFETDLTSGVVDIGNGIRIHVRQRREIAGGIGMAWAGRSPTEVVFGHVVDDADAIKALVARAVDAGARPVPKLGKEVDEGSLAHVRDLDGHIWKISLAGNPFA